MGRAQGGLLGSVATVLPCDAQLHILTLWGGLDRFLGGCLLPLGV